jgi:hypothetical protein
MVTFSTGSVEIQAQAHVTLNALPPALAEPPGGLYPLRSAVWDIDEYRLMSGWPVPIPPYDVHGVSLVSASGEVLRARETPTSVATGATVRWISDLSYYSTTTLRWLPHQDNATSPVWETASTHAPVLINDYEYRVGDERFHQDALNFDSDTQNYLTCDFRSLFGGSAGYTVILVMNPNSSYGNNVAVPYNGLWCPASTTDPWMSVTMQGQYLYFETESMARTRVISIATALDSNAPLYVAMVFARPSTTFYVGSGPSSIRSKSANTGTAPMALGTEVHLGRGTTDLLHCADMALFDVGVYADNLSGLQVRDEFALLSQIYGGDT